jgi:succinyl-CoA synthetase beta subunit
MIGTRLVTYQTGPEGVPVGSVLVEEAVDNASELYLGMVIDGSTGGVLAIASEAGGVEIEEVAASTPEKIVRVAIDPMLGLQGYQGRTIAYDLNLDGKLARQVASLVEGLYSAFVSLDCSLVEINPLVVTTENRVLAVDAKVNLDDDALYRRRDLAELRDEAQEDPKEVEAGNAGVSYVKLDGNVGCIVNGAGLAMATMDVVVAAGASPANFLDVGGGADEEQVAKALSIILSDDGVEKVLVNVFGGILRCDIAARGLIMASEAMPGAVRPMVVRMLGTNAEEGKRLLSESDLDIRLVDDLNEAAEAIRG